MKEISELNFPDDVSYAEDHEWSLRLKEAGHAVDYVAESIAVHSHNYTVKQAYKRAFGDSKASAATARSKSEASIRYTVILGWIKDIVRDWKWFAGEGRRKEIFHAACVRWGQRLGRYNGFHDGWKAYNRDKA